MFLKKLKINGFKSFANGITIDFSAPLTAIVGPNGSGKSNVVDAIRWAMGEQSAKSLRGSKMSDIIFAGSADHKPLKKASVTLYFDNSNNDLGIDKKTVIIKRSVNIDGQSEYYLNGSSCRLKDIEELLMDTGLGNDTYSIVGQGKIDSILNSKAEKLRELFEEAAGIVKHKTRKNEAERRLNKTRQDLQRVKDLIWELDKQVKPLKKSAEKASKYKRLRNELKVLEVNLLLDRWENNKKDLMVTNKEKQNLLYKLNKAEKDLESIKRNLEEKKDKLRNDEELIERLQETFYQTKIKREQAENNINVLLERDKGIRREKSNLELQITNISNRKEELKCKENSLIENLNTVKEEEIELLNKIQSIENTVLKQRKLINEKKNSLLNRRNAILNENMEINDINSAMEKAKEKSRYLEIEINKMIEKRENVSLELDKVISEIEKLEKIKEECQKEFITSNNILISQKEKQEELKNELKDIKSKKEKIKEKLNHDSSKLSILQGMEENYQGYFRGVKTILKEKESIPGIIGVVADLINLEKKYELAIETALGAKLQNIVTEDDNVARKAVKFLKKSKGGRATFLPLNMVRAKKAKIDKMDITNMDGYIGLASEVINYDDKLDSVFNSLLGKTIVAKDIDTATEISKKIKSSLKVVTLAGEFINSTGAITGGSQVKNNKGLLARNREIEELLESVKKSKKDVEYENTKENEKEERLEELTLIENNKSAELRELEFKINDLNKDLANFNKDKTRLEVDLKNIENDFTESKKKLAENNEDKLKLEEKLSTINNEFSKEKEQINEKENEIKALEENEEKINKTLTDMRIQLATIREKKSNIISETKELADEIIKSDEIKEKTNLEKNELIKKLDDIQIRKKKLEELEKKFRDQISNLEKEYNEKQEQFEKEEINLEKFEEKYSNEQSQLSSLKDENHKLDLKINRMEDKNLQISERLSEEYGIDANLGIEERIEINNYKQITRKIKEFKDSIKALGPVNIAAIEEYEELLSRLNYLKEQEEDLLTARNSIEQIIAELEKKMSELFYQTFVEVKEEFENIFEKLFNGGKAALRLNKPENLLETGVEIEAQPPGKQLKKLSLMSGGERALTAIALVFAFLKVNPSPMYILDEIDAPLDDANVRRFASYLNEYSQYVQFLLITHNKIMMTEAMAIYGITMESKGVSKMVSLRLDEDIA
ncbi:chromosome segregation protein SMC [Natronospora cellulosivora (SeqCode)]